MTDVRHIAFRIDPGELFDPETTPLLPTKPPRRVAVYTCSCGTAGCGVAACLIQWTQAGIAWRDFRDFTGVYERPVLDGDVSGEFGSSLPVPDLLFDPRQYHAAVAEATKDRSWETDERRIARLLRARLRRDEARLLVKGYRLGSVWPSWGGGPGCTVELLVGERHSLLHVDRPRAAKTDDEAIEAMAAAVLAARGAASA